MKILDNQYSDVIMWLDNLLVYFCITSFDTTISWLLRANGPKAIVSFVVFLWVSSSMCALELNLTQLTTYAVPEYQDQDAQVKRHTVRNIIDRVVATLGFKTGAYFSASDFEKIIKEVVQRRSINLIQGRLIQKIIPQTRDHFVLWGALNGAFHSLVRDLVELYRQGHINEDLTIADNCYYIFNGDVIGDSGYVLETFMLVVYLMYKNPGRVFYIKGHQEDKEHWKESPFAQQLVHIADQLRLFFNSLPLALYVLPSDQVVLHDKKIVRFSYYAPDYAELNEAGFSYFFDPYTPWVISLLDTISGSSMTNYHIAAYVYVEQNKNEYAPSQGLLLKAKDKGHTCWTTISSPTDEFRKQYQFFNDAFVVVALADASANWTIQLHYQDARTMSGFKTDNAYDIFSGNQVFGPLQEKAQQLKHKLQELNHIKQQLYDDCVSDVTMPKKNEDILSFIKRRNWQQLLAHC